MWSDNWSNIGPLNQLIRNSDIFRAGFNAKDRVADCIENHSWKWPDWLVKYPALLQLEVPLIVPNKKDLLKCLDNNLEKVSFIFKNVWESIRKVGLMVEWSKLIWFSQCISKHAFLLRLVYRKSLKTQDRMKIWDGGLNIAIGCLFCHQTLESHNHLFFECPYSKEIWFDVRKFIRMDCIPEVWDAICNHLMTNFKSKEAWSIISWLTIGALVYFIWQVRNARIFTKRIQSPKQLSDEIIQEVKLKLMSLNWKTSSSLNVVKLVWNLAQLYRV